jgi:tetratricopeptide (TPR) repeat protein
MTKRVVGRPMVERRIVRDAGADARLSPHAVRSIRRHMRPSVHIRLAVALALLAGIVPAAGAQRAGAPADTSLARLDLATLLARGDSAWQAGREGAFPFYHEAVRRDTAASTRALFRLATLHAWRNELAQSIALHERYVREEPADGEGRLALARVQAWASRFAASLATYDDLLARIPDHREAALGRAQTLAWAGRMRESIAAYRAWLDAHPGDRAAELDLARTESWAGRLDAAEARYQRLAEAGEAAGEKGVARVSAWRGDLARSERIWRSLSARYPEDPEVWTGLAQVLRWSGRAQQAEHALERALAAEPAYGDARAQLPWVRADLATGVEPFVIHANDSDENRSTLVGVTGTTRPWWNGRVSATVSRREASLGATRATSSGARTAATWSPLRARLTLRGELGASRLEADVEGASAKTVTRPAMALSLSAQPDRRVSVGVGLSRVPFDEVAVLIANRLVAGALDVDAGVQLTGRLALGLAYGRGAVTGGSLRNSRDAASGSLRWTVRRGLSVAASVRTFAWDRASFAGEGASRVSDGYFAPARYRLAEGSARWELGRDLGWFGGVEAGLGEQMVRPFVDERTAGASRSNLAERATTSIGFRFAPGAELAASAGFANVAAPQTVSAAEYRAWNVGLRARIRL